MTVPDVPAYVQFPRGSTVHFVYDIDGQAISVTGRVTATDAHSVIVLARDGRSWSCPPSVLRHGAALEAVA